MATYRVTYTSRQIISKFNAAGEKIGEEQIDKPQVVTGLTYSSAVAYKGCDNFEFEVERQEAQKRLPKPQSSGFDAQLKKAKKVAKKAAPQSASRVQTAAEKGDMAAALDVA